MAAKREAKPVFDRLPPQNIDAERAVLGAMLLNSDAVGTAIEILHEEASDVFYSEAHQYIYSAMLSLFRKNSPIDDVTLMEQLTRDAKLEDCGGVSYLAQLTGAVPTSANVDYYARIVLDAAVLRRLITTCTSAVGEAYNYEGEVNQLLDRAEAEIFAIAQKRQLNPVVGVRDLVDPAVALIERQLFHHEVAGLLTGYKSLDDILGGLQKSDIIIIAARPSVGKTAFALNIAAHVARHEKKGVLVFSLEMGKEQLTHRLLCLLGGVNARRLRTGFLGKDEWSKVVRGAEVLKPLPLSIDDTTSITLLELRSKARRHFAHHDISLVIIDYLQLMTSGRRVESRQTEIAEISRGLKALARELGVPVIALSQLNREAEKDDVGEPKLSNLRESGAIEQDADVVMLLWRPNAQPEENSNEIKITVAKHRNGPTGTVKLNFFKEMQRFASLEENVEEPEDLPPSSHQEFDEEELPEGEEDVPF